MPSAGGERNGAFTLSSSQASCSSAGSETSARSAPSVSTSAGSPPRKNCASAGNGPPCSSTTVPAVPNHVLAAVRGMTGPGWPREPVVDPVSVASVVPLDVLSGRSDPTQPVDAAAATQAATHTSALLTWCIPPPVGENPCKGTDGECTGTVAAWKGSTG